MLKEKFDKTKKFVKDHKKQIIKGVVITGTAAGLVVLKSMLMKELRKDAAEINQYVEAYDKAVDLFEEKGMLDELNKKYEQYDFSNIYDDPEIEKIYDQYINEYETKLNEIIESQL